MSRASIDIYSGPLLDVTARCEVGLKQMFGTKEQIFIYAANGHGVWDAALSNTMSRGEKILVLESGRFAVGWGEVGEVMGLDVEIIPGNWHSSVDLAALAQRLDADKSHSIRAILCVQVDTASGVCNDIPAIRKTIDAAGHPALFMVDAIASLGTMPFLTEGWGVDVAISASQKGLMSPPGLGFVAASSRAMLAHKAADLRTRYWDWGERSNPNHYQKYCGTPPEQLLFGLSEAFEMIAEEGHAAIFQRHATLKRATQAAISSWEDIDITPNVPNPISQAPSVSVFNLPDGLANKVISYCRDNCGVILGGGLGKWAGKSVRIGHMGHINAPTLIGAIACIDLSLKILGTESAHSGAAAAVAALAQETSE